MSVEMSKRACVFSVDDNYAAPFKVFWHSLMKTDSIPIEAPVYVLHSETLSEKSANHLKKFLISYNREVRFLDMTDLMPNELPLSHHITTATYFRLFLAEALPDDISSAVYLDCDMLAVSSVKKLFEVDIRGLIAAVDHFSPSNGLRLWDETGGAYFQAGVMLANLEAWRNAHLSSRFLEVLREQSHRILWWDQDVLNIVCDGQWQRLPVWFNLSTAARIHFDTEKLQERARLLHFDGSSKPWKNLGNSWHDEQWYTHYRQALGYPFDKKSIKRSVIRRVGSVVRRVIAASREEITAF